MFRLEGYLDPKQPTVLNFKDLYKEVIIRNPKRKGLGLGLTSTPQLPLNPKPSNYPLLELE